MTEDQTSPIFDPDPDRCVEMTVGIVAAFVAHNALPAADLPALIRSVHDTVAGLGLPDPALIEAAPVLPAVPIRKSVTEDYLVSLEDGRKFKSLKRHLATEYGMTPDQYRAKWGLPKDYPMVAPAYAKARSALAKTMGLGRKTPEATAA